MPDNYKYYIYKCITISTLNLAKTDTSIFPQGIWDDEPKNNVQKGWQLFGFLPKKAFLIPKPVKIVKCEEAAMRIVQEGPYKNGNDCWLKN